MSRTALLGILLASILCCTMAALSSAQQNIGDCSTMRYEHANMIDPRPLHVSTAQGSVKDIASLSVGAGCVGVFSEDHLKLIASGVIHSDGTFSLAGLPRGEYVLIVSVEGFCPANNEIVVGGHHLRKRKIVANMRPRGIDTCSWLELK